MDYNDENVVTTSYYKSEDQLQAACFQWANNNFPQIRGLLWAVPNQKGTRNMLEMQKLKAMGVLPGVHDLHLFYRGKYVTIELKMPGGKATPDQLAFGARIVQQGGIWMLCTGAAQFVNDFKELIKYLENA